TVQLRLRPAEKAVIALAAELRQTTLSNFMLEHAYQAAQQALADQVHFALPPDCWQAFQEALDAPPRQIPALRKLIAEETLFDEREDASAYHSSPARRHSRNRNLRLWRGRAERVPEKVRIPQSSKPVGAHLCGVPRQPCGRILHPCRRIGPPGRDAVAC